MRWTCVPAVAFAAVLVCAAPVRAADDAAKELDALEIALETSELEWKQAYGAFDAKYKAFAEKFPGTPQALDAKLRRIEFTSRDDESPVLKAEAAAIADEIFAEFGESPGLAGLYKVAHAFTAKKWRAIAAELDQPTRHDVVKAATLLFKGSGLFDNERSTEEQKAEGRAMLTKLTVKPFACMEYRGTTFDVLADAYLNACKPGDLEVGKPAPEIVGQSLDGKTIKLSDFKGKVVVVDFFGDW